MVFAARIEFCRHPSLRLADTVLWICIWDCLEGLIGMQPVAISEPPFLLFGWS